MIIFFSLSCFLVILFQSNGIGYACFFVFFVCLILILVQLRILLEELMQNKINLMLFSKLAIFQLAGLALTLIGFFLLPKLTCPNIPNDTLDLKKNQIFYIVIATASYLHSLINCIFFEFRYFR